MQLMPSPFIPGGFEKSESAVIPAIVLTDPLFSSASHNTCRCFSPHLSTWLPVECSFSMSTMATSKEFYEAIAPYVYMNCDDRYISFQANHILTDSKLLFQPRPYAGLLDVIRFRCAHPMRNP